MWVKPKQKETPNPFHPHTLVAERAHGNPAHALGAPLVENHSGSRLRSTPDRAPRRACGSPQHAFRLYVLINKAGRVDAAMNLCTSPSRQAPAFLPAPPTTRIYVLTKSEERSKKLRAADAPVAVFVEGVDGRAQLWGRQLYRERLISRDTQPPLERSMEHGP